VTNGRTTERWIEDLAGVFTDPIIVYPGGWEDTIPPKLREAVTIERLIENVKHAKGEPISATDAECCIYLYTVCMCQPLSHDWAQIYFYLGSRFIEKDGRQMPDDIRVDELTRNQQEDLDHLRHWISERRFKARTDRRLKERAEAKAEGHEEPRKRRVNEQAPSPQLQLF
jgi:hypothetical protein